MSKGAFELGVVPRARPPGLPGWLKALLLIPVLAAPFLFGSASPTYWVPLYSVATLIGTASWVKARLDRSLGKEVPEVPGGRLLLALLGLAALQLVPLPPAVLKLVSPGTWAFHYLGLPRTTWHAIAVSPLSTFRGMLCVGGASLLYATAFREFRAPASRRRVALALALSGAVLGGVGLAQAASGSPRTIYGLYEVSLQNGWAIWGPYLNRNHFAGYLALVIPLGVALALEGSLELWRLFRKRGLWGALGDPAFGSSVQWSALAVFLVVALLAPQSRGGLAALMGGLLAFLVLMRHGVLAILLVVTVAAVGFFAIDTSDLLDSLGGRGMNRAEIWRDTLRMVADFPAFGIGLNGYWTAFRPYQSTHRETWVTAAHNDFLEMQVDLGAPGTLILIGLLWQLARSAWLGRGREVMAIGLFAAAAAALTHALVDFSLQLPANGATFALICGLAMGAGGPQVDRP